MGRIYQLAEGDNLRSPLTKFEAQVDTSGACMVKVLAGLVRLRNQFEGTGNKK